MNSKYLIFDIEKMFAGALIGGAATCYKYENGIKTDIPDGIKCNTILPACNFERIHVKIKNLSRLELPTTAVPVQYKNLKVKIYNLNGSVGVSATADAVILDSNHVATAATPK